jgi:hypothetical protein
MLVKHEDKYYWFLYANKSGSTFLSSVIQTISKNNELFKIVYQDREWTRELFLDEGYGLDNFEVIMIGRNPYMRFVSQFYHWWLNPFAHDAHDFGGKWMWDYPKDVVIQQKNDSNQILENKFMEILNDDGVSNKQKHNYMIKFWFGWVQSQPEEIRIEKFRHFAKVFYAYMKEWGYGAKQFQQWAGQHLNWQVSDLREVNRLFPMSNNLDQVYDDEYIDVFIKKWSKNTLKIENLKDDFPFKDLIDIDEFSKKLANYNTKTPYKKETTFESKRRIYSRHYDDQTIKIVNDIYKFDFKMFNYKVIENTEDLLKSFMIKK